ncbi:hypothetical protein EDD28_2447 [Salana multivorans]|uniref:Uncharacterized protein n=2 Tax=Salana multivorans TaxID=120377 RepID=A0A3N2D2M6_9MICO|nr:hypothetical protein EDD28_3455 [Salana multivorans]ROR97838.1 hypothetical protein EDD28_2447 [Salana multivorans]
MTSPPAVGRDTTPCMSSSMRPERTPLPTLAWCENAIRDECERRHYVIPGDETQVRAEVRRAAKQYRREWITHLDPPVDLRILGIYQDPTAWHALNGIPA